MNIPVIIVLVTAVILLGLAVAAKFAPASVSETIKSVWNSIVTWQWTKRLLHWLIISAGTMSELAFLVASLWMSVNASVHKFVLLFITQQMSEHISELAATAYVALPELIVALAVVVTIGHIRLWLYDRKNYTAVIWAVLYGLPTLVFLFLSLVTVGSSVTSITFQLPGWMIVIRALSGYMFAFTSLLYTQLGNPQERDRLQNKDTMIAELREEMTSKIAELTADRDKKVTELDAEINKLNAIINDQKTLLAESKKAETELIKAVNKSSEMSLQAYSEECQNWLKSGVKSVEVADITRYTGHSKRKIEGAITKGILKVSTRNKSLILVDSLTEWLKITPVSTGQKDPDTAPLLHVVNA